LRILIWIGICISLVGCQTTWLASNASGVVSRMAGSKTRDELLSSKNLPGGWKSALEELPAILDLARDSGFNVGSAYQRIDIDVDPVSYIVVAAKPGSMTLHLWEFPIVGEVPYKGFRFLDHAEAESRLLESRGLIAEVFPVSAFSSLGWFPDTLPGGLLGVSETHRVRTIYHELVHRTIFFPGRADLNESLANFFADELARKWFIKRDGPHSSALKLLAMENADSDLLREHLLRLMGRWSPETLHEDLRKFSEQLQMESWQSQMGQQISVRKWTLPTILMEQVYDAGAWPWAEIWQECNQDLDVLIWRTRQEIVGTP